MMSKRKRIVFIGFTKIKYMPYMHFYLDMIPVNEYEIHLIYWNRDNGNDQVLNSSVALHPFNKEMEDTIPLRRKIFSILQFGKYAQKELSIINPDLLIVMHSTTAVTIYATLIKKYKERYIFDYRDITYERIGVYKKMVGRIVKKSFVTFTSSEDFKKYLPDETNKIYTSHNILVESMHKTEQYKSRIKRNKSEALNIGFWGLIRHTEYNRQIIKQLGNDVRFELHYYGRATGEDLELLEESEKKYNNVFFHGEYMPEERDTFAMRTDLIHNLYSNLDVTTPHAMGNKFYDGLVYRIPQLCSVGSYMGRLCKEHGVGLECDPFDEEFGDIIINYYNNLDFRTFNRSCDELLQEIVEDVKKGERKINEFIRYK